MQISTQLQDLKMQSSNDSSQTDNSSPSLDSIRYIYKPSALTIDGQWSYFLKKNNIFSSQVIQ